MAYPSCFSGFSRPTTIALQAFSTASVMIRITISVIRDFMSEFMDWVRYRLAFIREPIRVWRVRLSQGFRQLLVLAAEIRRDRQPISAWSSFIGACA